MKDIQVISFDMEGTLIDHSFSIHIWEMDIPRLYAEKHDLDEETARNRIFKLYERIGENNILWYDVGYWFDRLGLEGDWRELPEHRREMCRVYPEVSGVLNRLTERYPLVVTSNTIREFLEVQLDCFEVSFDHVFSAPSDFGEVKKSRDFYQRICDVIGIKPEELLHVGDHYRFDYIAAKDLGVNAYYLDRSGNETGEDVVHNLEDFEKILDN
jgi:putative hydrolase of the HAD superfamily